MNPPWSVTELFIWHKKYHKCYICTMTKPLIPRHTLIYAGPFVLQRPKGLLSRLLGRKYPCKKYACPLTDDEIKEAATYVRLAVEADRELFNRRIKDGDMNV